VATPRGFLLDLNGQETFSFVVDMESVKLEVIDKIPEEKVAHFTLAKKPLKLDRPATTKLTQRRVRRRRT